MDMEIMEDEASEVEGTTVAAAGLLGMSQLTQPRPRPWLIQAQQQRQASSSR